MSRESFSDTIRAVHEFEKRNGVFGPVILQESKDLPRSSDKGSPDPIDRLFARFGLERESYPKAEVKVITEAPTKAKLISQPPPMLTMKIEEARGRLIEAIEGGDSSKITPDMYARLCR
jgi:hypothetical protein